jgi:hypothetical protein
MRYYLAQRKHLKNKDIIIEISRENIDKVRGLIFSYHFNLVEVGEQQESVQYHFFKMTKASEN